MYNEHLLEYCKWAFSVFHLSYYTYTVQICMYASFQMYISIVYKNTSLYKLMYSQ